MFVGAFIAYLTEDVPSTGFINGHPTGDYYVYLARGIILICAIIVLSLTAPNRMAYDVRADEGHVLWGLIVLGALMLIQSLDLLTMYLSLEVQTFGIVALAAMGKNSDVSYEASMKYFIGSMLSSTLVLVGIAFVYLAFGTVNLCYLRRG